jgi:uncharacterized phage-like protein YoqJ
VIASVTGHRELEHTQYVHAQLKWFFHDFKIEKLLQGMALGADQQAALAAFQSRVPYIAVRPWAGHSVGKYYDAILMAAEDFVIVNDSPTYPGPWVYQKRNEYLVDNSDILVAVWDGRTEKSGTYNCIKYAVKKKKPIWRIDPKTCTSGKLVLE